MLRPQDAPHARLQRVAHPRFHPRLSPLRPAPLHHQHDGGLTQAMSRDQGLHAGNRPWRDRLPEQGRDLRQVRRVMPSEPIDRSHSIMWGASPAIGSWLTFGTTTTRGACRSRGPPWRTRAVRSAYCWRCGRLTSCLRASASLSPKPSPSPRQDALTDPLVNQAS